MTLLRLFCGAYLWLFLVAPPQGVEPKDLPTNKGSIIGENTYVNPALKMRVTLPGVWHIFDRTMYSTDEQKRKEKEAEERVTSTCRGALCGHAQIDVALQAPSLPPAGRPQYAIFLLAYELAPEYQNPRLLRGFAETMTLGSMGNQWFLTASWFLWSSAENLPIGLPSTIETHSLLRDASMLQNQTNTFSCSSQPQCRNHRSWPWQSKR